MTGLAKMAAAADMARKSIQSFLPPKTDFGGTGKAYKTNHPTANTQIQPSDHQNLLLKWALIIGVQSPLLSNDIGQKNIAPCPNTGDGHGHFSF